MDGHFGNHPAFHILRQHQLHLFSKQRYDQALFFAYAGPKPKRGTTPGIVVHVDICNIPDKY
ncbi:MAG: hypothetical protein JEZ06_23945 [Anaerolineaceae bacterium]|nr:hypothetical protein [Anaerolineaceae bacterium]